jgi:1-acyl-sn-glycerol-3-phosphate acyltransferase
VIRTIWTLAVTFVTTTFFASGAVLGGLLRFKSARWFDGCTRYWSHSILWAAGTEVIAEGTEHIPQDQPEIIVSNHVSWLDIPAIATTLPKRMRFVAKKELTRIPLFGSAMVNAGHISIDRQDRSSAIESLERAGAALRSDNSSVVIFAEGTRSADGTLQPFKKGAFMLAVHTGVNVVPTAVIGSHEVLPKHHWRLRKGSIIVRYGEPIPMTGFGPNNRDELVQLVRARIEELLAQPHPRLAPPADPTTR